ncbi:MAG: class I SAM-dependent methyltransferase [Alphaproteobacteria bacterium]|nr:class I SAM-dependent methyltransferase [Alphaproteobacteria bacterium]MCB9928395.1 class I SAM-dependent methyltransferase [Alphaproteobacteria bacterium]
MSDSDKVFSGSIPEIYDTYLVPLIFEHYAADLARRVAVHAPASVLETAAGSGVVTRALAPLLATTAAYTVTDLNQPMLARAQARQPADDRLAWQQADALALPFGDQAFDAVCCQFGVMFFPDRVAGYREARRVLKPGGRFLFNVWDRIEENVFADVVTAAAATIFPHDPSRFLARTPHGHHDADRIAADLRAAGFADIAVETVAAVSSAASHRDPAIAYCQGTPLRNEIEHRDPGALEAVTDTAADAIRNRFGSGPVSAKIQAYVVGATRPA